MSRIHPDNHPRLWRVPEPRWWHRWFSPKLKEVALVEGSYDKVEAPHFFVPARGLLGRLSYRRRYNLAPWDGSRDQCKFCLYPRLNHPLTWDADARVVDL